MIKRIKWWVKFSALMVLGVALTGCMAGEGFDDYMKAVNQTEEMTHGASKIEVEINSEFNQDFLSELSQEDRYEIQQMNHFEFEIEKHFDRSNHQSIIDAYAYMGRLGMDFKVYQTSADQWYVKAPFSASLYQLNVNDFIKDNASKASENASKASENASQEVDYQTFFTSLGDDWNDLLVADNIFVGEKTLIQNKDGDVKATRFSVKPTKEQLSIFLKQIREALLKNPEVFKSFIKGFDQESELSESDYKELINTLLNAMTIEKYEEVAYVDVDGYLIEETVNITLNFNEIESGVIALERQIISFKTTHWDIEKEQNLNFDVISKSPIEPIENLEDWSVNK